jgi:hypothetical protein
MVDARKLNLSNPSYGTPFLRELGLAEQLTSLVWLAGPISGLIAQPLIGRSQYSHSLVLSHWEGRLRRSCVWSCRYTYNRRDLILIDAI